MSEMKMDQMLVEDVIRENLGLNPEDNKLPNMSDEVLAWGLTRGSATVYIVLNQGNETNYLQVFSPIMRIDENTEVDFFKDLLTLNATSELCAAAFALKDNRIVLKSDRTTNDLDKDELFEIVVRVGRLADKYDDLLVEKYGK
jgi:T3SS (YopN, CesT) and YbjN peptide-binding chaperone 1